MRLNPSNDPLTNKRISEFSEWLLKIGEGTIGTLLDGVGEVNIPDELLLCPTSDPISTIVCWTYDNLFSHQHLQSYYNDRAILAPTIDMVNTINDFICNLLPGDSFEYLSCDSICRGSTDNDFSNDLYGVEFLNTLGGSGIPPHKLLLKVGVPIMLLRNIDQSLGLCNGTRMVITKLAKTVIEAVTINGSNPNEKVLLHRMDMNPSQSNLPFTMQRRQFPIQVSFAMTINKSQGQSLKKVGLCLTKPVFTHGQLYVALSRVRSIDGLRIVLNAERVENYSQTTNVVFQEVFMCLQN